MTANDVINVAKKFVGVTEYPSGSNKVIFNTVYYGRVVSGDDFPWCCVFMWYIFKQAGASKLFCGGAKVAQSALVMRYAKEHGQFIKNDYQDGDLLLFNFNGGGVPKHIGICTGHDKNDWLTTIEGNTGAGNDANGGGVMARLRSKSVIVGAYRPAYEEEDEEMKQEDFNKMAQEYEKQKYSQPLTTWGQEDKDAITWCESQGLIKGDERGYKHYESGVTRHELAVMFKRLFNLIKGQSNEEN